LIVTTDAVAKYLGSQGINVLQVVWARFAFQLLFIVAIRPRSEIRRMLATSRPGLHVVRALITLGITIMFFLAVRLMPLAEATTLSLMSPLFITALSVPILGEYVGPRRWIAVIVGFIGVIVMIRPGSGIFQWAALLPLGTALFAAIYHITTRILHRIDNPLITLNYTATLNTVLASAALPFVWMSPDALGWLLLASLGVLGTCAHFLLIRAFSMAPPSVVSPFIYTQLVTSMCLGIVVFGEVPGIWTLSGAGIIAGSGIYILYSERVAHRREGASS
jgi:drug/metabolite transporter (DMT)-like permease